MKRAIIFDFDGTIADTVPIMLDIYHKKAETKGWPVITPTTLVELKKGSIKQAMRWAGVKFWQIPGLLSMGRSYMKERANDIQMFDGIPQLMKDIPASTDLYVLSNNDSTTIEQVLIANGLNNKVRVLPRPSLFNKDKSIKRLLKLNKYFNKDVIMVGDEVRDIEAGRKAKIHSVGVSWGLQDKSLLKKAKADEVCDSVGELNIAIERIFSN
ncbi:MAG: HAD hydrolase-like protein [Patescibacteria group bacterium]